MAKFDPYQILGLNQDDKPNADQIKAAFRKKAMEHHPDRNGGCELAAEKFKQVNEAHSILSDDQKRAHFDRFGNMDGFGGMGNGGPKGPQWTEEELRQQEEAVRRARGRARNGGSYERERSGSGSHGGSQQRQSGTGGGQRSGAGSSGYGGYSWYGHEDAYSRRNASVRQQVQDEIAAARRRSAAPDFSRFNFNMANLDGLDMRGGKFPSHVHSCSFVGADLRDVNFTDASIRNCRFSDTTKLDGANFTRAIFETNSGFPKFVRKANFTNASITLEHGLLSNRTFEECIFKNTRLPFLADIRNSTFKRCSFDGIQSHMARFSNVVMDAVEIKERLHTSFDNVTFKNLSAHRKLDLSSATLRNVTIDGPLHGLTIGEHQLNSIQFLHPDRSGLRVVDLMGRETRHSFHGGGNGGGASARAAEEDLFGAGRRAGSHGGGFGGGGRRPPTGGAEEFMEGILHPKSGMSFGKVAAVAAGAVILGGVAWLIAHENEKNNPEYAQNLQKGYLSPQQQQLMAMTQGVTQIRS